MAFGAPVEPSTRFPPTARFRAVPKSLDSPGSTSHNPGFSTEFIPKVVPCTKRALTARQMQRLYGMRTRMRS